MFLPSEVLSDAFSSISRQQLADLQLVNRQFDSIIAAKVYPLHGEIGDFLLSSENNGGHSIDLDTAIDSAPIPLYLRFLVCHLSPRFSFTSHFIDQFARLKNAFDGAQLTIHLYSGDYKTEHDLRLQTLDTLEKVTPIFHKIRDINLFWCDANITLPMGPEDDINILSTPLLFNCRSLLLILNNNHRDRFVLVSPNQVVDWLFPDEEREGRYLLLWVNQDAEAILTDLISKKIVSKNERRCEVIVENRDPVDYYEAMGSISQVFGYGEANAEVRFWVSGFRIPDSDAPLT
ncbi:hypothetical protein Ddc_18337 [Ditylenchus destructor]|nr:hypothetical protein Ddc_18337 [Ditylenchus destructor]